MIFLFYFILTIPSEIQAETVLFATILKTKLPSAISRHSAIYDGNTQSIFIFGGFDGIKKSNRILQFNVTTPSVKVVGEMPSLGSGGQVEMDEDGNIFYFGGGPEEKDVYKFDPKNKICELITALPFSVSHSTGLKYNNKILFFGGWQENCKSILSFDFSTLKLREFGHIDAKVCGSLEIRYGRSVYIFRRDGFLELLDLEELQKQGISWSIPELSGYASAASLGSFSYVIGGFKNTRGTPAKHILKLDMDNGNISFVLVENYILNEDEFFYFAPAAVLVPNLNRVYLFGGDSVKRNKHTFHDSIWYIDINPLTGVNNSKAIKKKTFQKIFPKSQTDDTNSWMIENPSANFKAFESYWILMVILVLGVASLVIYGAWTKYRKSLTPVRINGDTIIPVENNTNSSDNCEDRETASAKTMETHLGKTFEECTRTSKLSHNEEISPEKNLIWKSSQPLELLCTNPIGRGSFAEVYKAKHSLQSAYFAVKKIRIYKALQHMQWDLGKVLREVENLGQILNPNVVRMWSCWIEDEKGKLICANAVEKLQFMEWSSTQDYFLFLQMDLCDSTLRDWLTENATLEQRMPHDLNEMFRQILNGLRGIHQERIIHRDIKPNNIFHCHDGHRWKIGDLGLSVKFAECSANEDTIVGCQSYRSPEMAISARELRQYSFKTDVFSLGLCFLEVICPVGLKTHKTFEAVRNANDESDLKLIVEFDPIVNPNFIKLVSLMLLSIPDERIDISNSLVDELLA